MQHPYSIRTRRYITWHQKRRVRKRKAACRPGQGTVSPVPTSFSFLDKFSIAYRVNRPASPRSARFTMDLDYRIQSLPVTGVFCRLRSFRPMDSTRDARPGAGLRIQVVPSKSKVVSSHPIMFHILGRNQPCSVGPCR